jgi:HEPN domain-containing protein
MVNDDWERYWDPQSEYEHDLIMQGLKDISEDNVRHYLSTHGQEVYQRACECLTQARELHKASFWSASLVTSAVVTELVIRSLLVRPLIQGAFLSDEWANLLTNKIVLSRSSDARSLLPCILQRWKVDINKRRLRNGSPLWQTIQSHLWKRRNEYLHDAQPIEAADSNTALECASGILKFVEELLTQFQVSLTK